MKNEKIQNIISKVKGKKNLGVDDKYVFEILDKYLKNPKIKEIFEKPEKEILKNKVFKKLTKEIRKELYKVHGLYQVKKQSNKQNLLKQLEKARNIDDTRKTSREILKQHTSSRERLSIYNKLYLEILKLKPESILDLASGLNPCSIILSNFKGSYYAYEISKDDVDFLNKYFKAIKKYNINGKAFVKDITKDFNFEKTDVCFLFKFLDLLGKNRKLFFINLLKNLKCKYLIVSFSKKTISLKQMKNTERNWFINLLNSLNLSYKRIDFENEFFYIIKLKIF
ncbi:MAG: hypothetical protein AABW58_02390 [Nanoarchaeota archaeon]